jgi:hypothetical protein
LPSFFNCNVRRTQAAAVGWSLFCSRATVATSLLAIQIWIGQACQTSLTKLSPEINANSVHTVNPHTPSSADKAPHALTFRAFGRRFYPEQLNKNIYQKNEKQHMLLSVR